MNTLITLVLVLVIVGLLMYVVDTLLPIDARIKKVIHVILILAVVLWIVQAFLPALVWWHPK